MNKVAEKDYLERKEKQLTLLLSQIDLSAIELEAMIEAKKRKVETTFQIILLLLTLGGAAVSFLILHNLKII